MSKIKSDSRANQLRSLELGKVLVFPKELYTSISADCTRYGKMWGKKFTMESDNEARTVTVTRIA